MCKAVSLCHSQNSPSDSHALVASEKCSPQVREQPRISGEVYTLTSATTRGSCHDLYHCVSNLDLAYSNKLQYLQAQGD